MLGFARRLRSLSPLLRGGGRGGGGGGARGAESQRNTSVATTRGGAPSPLPSPRKSGYSIHTSQNPILRQWVTRTHPLGQPRTPDPSQGIRKTHVFPLRISTERIKSVHSTAARGERERGRSARCAGFALAFEARTLRVVERTGERRREGFARLVPAIELQQQVAARCVVKRVGTQLARACERIESYKRGGRTFGVGAGDRGIELYHRRRLELLEGLIVMGDHAPGGRGERRCRRVH